MFETNYAIFFAEQIHLKDLLFENVPHVDRIFLSRFQLMIQKVTKGFSSDDFILFDTATFGQYLHYLHLKYPFPNDNNKPISHFLSEFPDINFLK